MGGNSQLICDDASCKPTLSDPSILVKEFRGLIHNPKTYLETLSLGSIHDGGEIFIDVSSDAFLVAETVRRLGSNHLERERIVTDLGHRSRKRRSDMLR